MQLLRQIGGLISKKNLIKMDDHTLLNLTSFNDDLISIIDLYDYLKFATSATEFIPNIESKLDIQIIKTFRMFCSRFC